MASHSKIHKIQHPTKPHHTTPHHSELKDPHCPLPTAVGQYTQGRAVSAKCEVMGFCLKLASGVSIQQRRPPLYLLTNAMVVVAAHTPCRGGGGAWTISLRRAPTPKRVPHRVPNPARRTFCQFRASHHRFMGCLVPQYSRFELFRVLEHRFMGSPIPQCGRFESFRVSRGAQSQNFGCVCYCVSRGNARNRLTHALRTQKKAPYGIGPSLTFTISTSQGTACTAFVPKPPP